MPAIIHASKLEQEVQRTSNSLIDFYRESCEPVRMGVETWMILRGIGAK
jgi:hypothetical protein